VFDEILKVAQANVGGYTTLFPAVFVSYWMMRQWSNYRIKFLEHKFIVGA